MRGDPVKGELFQPSGGHKCGLGGLQYCSLRTLGLWRTRDESGPTGLGLVAPMSIGEKWPEVRLLCPMVSILGQGGQAAVNLFCLTRAAILVHLAGLQSG